MLFRTYLNLCHDRWLAVSMFGHTLRVSVIVAASLLSTALSVSTPTMAFSDVSYFDDYLFKQEYSQERQLPTWFDASRVQGHMGFPLRHISKEFFFDMAAPLKEMGVQIKLNTPRHQAT